MPLIELQGANHLNKGGQLMLLATAQHMASHFPATDIGLSFRGSDWTLRERDGFKHIIYLERERFVGMNRMISAALSMLPRRIMKSKNLAREDEVMVVLDASGFRYSEQWGPEMLETNAARAERLTAIGIPFIFLPQAFGPFKTKRVIDAAKRLIGCASLVFARDRTSFEHIRSIVGDIPQLRMGPDFTNLVEPSNDIDVRVPDRSLMIVPNTRMLDKMGADVAAGYVPFLMDICEYGAKQGYKPVILVHDAEEDIALGRRIVAKAPVEVQLVFDHDPLRLKAYLSKATAVVSSRFHALVGALSCGTPSIAVGWSHKYDELLDDYGLPELSLTLNDKSTILKTLEQWSNDETRAEVKTEIASRAALQKQLALEMWQAVDEVISPMIRTGL